MCRPAAVRAAQNPADIHDRGFSLFPDDIHQFKPALRHLRPFSPGHEPAFILFLATAVNILRVSQTVKEISDNTRNFSTSGNYR